MKKLLCLVFALILTLSFTAFASDESTPVVEVTSIEKLTGFNSSSIATTTLTEGVSTLTSDDDLAQGWIVNLKNNANSAKSVTVFCGIYDYNGKLVKVISSAKSVAAETEDSIGLGTIIPETTATGVNIYGGDAKVRFFLWNNETDRSPYIEAISFDISSN